MPHDSYNRFGGLCALLAGIGALLYAVAFVVLQRQELYSCLLVANGLLGTAALIALHERVKATSAGFARLGMLLGVVGNVGASVHGAFDLSTVVGAGAGSGASADLANMADPRGFLTFFVTGLALLILARQARAGGTLPANLGLLGMATGLALVWIYLARLLILDAKNPILAVPVLVGGFILVPVWYLWLGTELRR